MLEVYYRHLPMYSGHRFLNSHRDAAPAAIKRQLTPTPEGNGADLSAASQSGTFTWSKLINPETLESETKTIQAC